MGLLSGRPVILDVDTGVDDALALLLAVKSPALDLRGVTCVAGNTGLEPVVRNTLRVLDAAGAPLDLPVAAGARRPLLDPPHLAEPDATQTAEHVHGADGLAEVDLPESTRPLDRRPAVELLRDLLLGAETPITLVPLAPMTNIALLLRTYPEVRPKIERIVLMGGAVNGGNVTAAAEFNVFADPEAAAIVFGAGVPVTMYGLDVFYSVRVSRADATALAASDVPSARLAGQLLLFRMNGELDSAEIGDAGAVAAVVAPDGLTTEALPVRVELDGRYTRGCTVVDRRAESDKDWDPHRGHPAPVADVALGVDAARYAGLFVETVS
ncbi:nucleoside hydrolase [Cryptosporangium arvum]|uniref:nucleoside hydrolase n=1 Tax=Cryptosporangium arvum TaxID=80871 RepID=UPI0004B05B4B|nr:nucleoside hydrolase [Cryptosporangium arvum]